MASVILLTVLLLKYFGFGFVVRVLVRSGCALEGAMLGDGALGTLGCGTGDDIMEGGGFVQRRGLS